MKQLDIRNIFGRKSKFSLPYKNPKTTATTVHEALDDLFANGGVTKVSQLPTTGEAGKIYYNTTDDTFYRWDSTGSTFKEVGSGSGDIVVKTAPSTIGISSVQLEHNVLTIVGTGCWNVTQDLGGDSEAILLLSYATDNLANDVARCYMARVTAPIATSFNITFPIGTIVPDDAAEVMGNLETGHVYEINVFHNVLLITDITSTNVDDTNRP